MSSTKSTSFAAATPTLPPLIIRYGNAVIFTCVALVITVILRQFLESTILLFFNLAVVLSAYYGGLGPGIVSAVLSIALSDYFVIAPLYEFTTFTNSERLLQAALFFLVAVIMSAAQDRRIQAERRRQNIALELQTILQSITDGVLAQDATGKSIFANAAAAQMNGFDSVDAMMKATVTELRSKVKLFNEDGSPVTVDQLPRYEVFRGSVADRVVRLVQNETGREMWLSMRAAPVFDSNGVPRLSVTVSRDITQLKQSQRQLVDLALELEKQRQRLKTVVGNIPAIIWEASGKPGEEGRVDFVNDYAQKMLGYPLDRWRTSPNMWQEIILPEDWESVVEQSKRVVEAGGSGVVSYRVYDAEGRVLHVDAYSTIVTNLPDGEARVYGVFMDVTERVKAQEAIAKQTEEVRKINEELMANERELRQLTETLDQERLRLATVLNNVPGIIWEGSLGAPGEGQRLEYLNNYLETTLGYPMQAWHDGTVKWEQIILEDDLPTLLAETRRIYDARGYGEVSFRARHQNGSVVFLEAHTTVIGEAEKPARAYGVFMNITERVQAQERLRQQADDLKAINNELSAFAYIASHDLQEPLRMVTSYLQLIESRYVDKLDEDGREFIGYAVDGAHRMKSLITDLLAYSRVQRGQEAFTPVDLEKVLKRVKQHLQIAIEENNAVITSEPLPTVMGRENELMQLFQNLIANAIKFRRDEPPKIDIGCKKGSRYYTISVKDNGIGIDPDYVDRIFIPFQRLHTREQYPGTGIGLAIVKKVIENKGGQIWVESQPGNGTTFYFTLPILHGA